jgi:hypothetical protein
MKHVGAYGAAHGCILRLILGRVRWRFLSLRLSGDPATALLQPRSQGS